MGQIVAKKPVVKVDRELEILDEMEWIACKMDDLEQRHAKLLVEWTENYK